MKNSAIIALLVVASACGGWRRDTGLEIAWAGTTALTACDVGGTLAATNMGRYDRMTRPGYVLGEADPVLQAMPGIGSRPSVAAMVLAPAAATALSYAVTGASIPRWLRISWFVAVAAVESITVARNAQWSGACGVAGTRFPG